MNTRNTVGAVLLLIATLFLTGCATTSADLRSSPMKSGSLHIDTPFIEARANFIDCVSKRYSGGFRMSYFELEVWDTTPGEHVVVEVVQDGLARRVLLSVDIRRTKSGGSDLTYFVGPLAVFSDWRAVIETWATGKEARCGFRSPGPS
jgi:hypothetical protein